MLHSTTINAPFDIVRRIIAEVDNWPVFFGPTIAAEASSLAHGSETLRLWARNGELDSVVKWSSTRRHRADGTRIDFSQDEPAPPLSRMRGSWTVRKVDAEATELMLAHDLSVAGDDDAFRRAESATDHNSTAELAAIKALAEDYGPTLQSHLVRTADDFSIPAPIGAVFDLLWGVTGWPELLAHVAAVDVRSEGENQHRFTMTLGDGSPGSHTVESVRVTDHDRWIGFKQLVTPDGVRGHCGTWSLAAENGTTQVTVRHLALLEPTAPANLPGLAARLGENLTRSSLGTLEAIRAHLAPQ